jgi:4'-phosphopantetheinyl transferase
MAFPPAPAALPPLSGDTIHLWSARLDPPPWRVAELARLLDPDEQARAARFRFDVHRRRFTVGRGFMRSVVGAYLGVEPARLVWSYGPKGKPFLAEPPAGDPFHFNLSNSEELALLGVERVREIGVDVEYLRPLSDLEALARRFFSPGESETLLALPPELRVRAFFNCWTRKEAYLKAVGDGLSAPLNRFDVTLAPGEAPRMLRLEGDAERAACWSLYHLEPAAGYLGAVAIEGGGWQIAAWRWEG